MLRAGFRLLGPLVLLAVCSISPARAQFLKYGWGGYAVPQFGYGYGCPTVYYQPYCSSYVFGYPYVVPGFWAGYTFPYLSSWAYLPYRAGYYGYGTRFHYGGGLRYPMYRAAPAFSEYGRYWHGYLGYRGYSGLGARFGAGGFRGGSFHGDGFHGGGRR